MIVQDIIDLSKYGELSGLAIKEDSSAIVAFINMGIMELYKRFPIEIKETVVDLQEATVFYDLPSDFMYPLEAYGEISSEYEEIEAPQIAINDVDDPLSIFFPSHNKVQIPSSKLGEHVSIVYVAKPERVTSDNLEVELPIPDTLVEALLFYIGFRAHTGIRSDQQSQNNFHWIRFDQSCKKARELGIAYPLDSWSTSERIGNRGFV